MLSDRADDIRSFHAILDRLATSVGSRRLGTCSGRMGWPKRGVYFFFEPGEDRTTTGPGPRVVRVGTHGLSAGSRTTLWNRLSQHKGTASSGGGNHRGSVFRLLVGAALLARDNSSIATWGRGASADRATVEAEAIHEREVTRHLGELSVVCLDIDDPPGPSSKRGFIERNAIALLSNAAKPAIDPPSANWLGLRSTSEKVRSSGLWNANHVHETHDPTFLMEFDRLVRAMEERRCMP